MARVNEVDAEVQGQGQTTRVREHHVVTDTVVLDPESPEAVQVPEGIGADSTVEAIHVVEAHSQGTAEEQLSGRSPDEVDNTRPADSSEAPREGAPEPDEADDGDESAE